MQFIVESKLSKSICFLLAENRQPATSPAQDLMEKEKKLQETLEYLDLRIKLNNGLSKVNPMVEKANFFIDIGQHGDAVFTSEEILDQISSIAVDIQALRAEAKPSVVDEAFNDLEFSTKKFIKVKLFDGARYLQISMRILTNTFASEETKEEKLRRLDSIPQVIPFTEEQLCLREEIMQKDLEHIQSTIDKKRGFHKIKPMIKKANYLLDNGEHGLAIYASRDIQHEITSKSVIIHSKQLSTVDEIFDKLELLAKKFIDAKIFDGATYLLPAMDKLVRTFYSGAPERDKLEQIKILTKKMPYHLVQHDFYDCG